MLSVPKDFNIEAFHYWCQARSDEAKEKTSENDGDEKRKIASCAEEARNRRQS